MESLLSVSNQAADNFDPIPVWEELSKRLSIIPLNGKVPIESQWERWCIERRPFKSSDFRHHNAGVACGPASGVLVLDIDYPDKFKTIRIKNGWELPETFTMLTGSGKYHLYFAYEQDGNEYGCRSMRDPDGEKDENGKVRTIFDVRGIGGQVVGLYSIHPDTHRRYTIYKNLPFAKTPAWLLKLALRYEEKRVINVSSVNWTGDIDKLTVSQNTLLSCQPHPNISR